MFKSTLLLAFGLAAVIQGGSVSGPKNPSLVLNPEFPKAYITKKLNMKCAVTNAADIGLSKLISITIKDTKDGFCIVSSASVFTGVKMSPDFGKPEVTSNIRGNAPYYLSMTWTKPTARLNGAYSCEIIGIGRHNQPFRSVTNHSIKIEKPTTEEMTNHTLELQDTFDKVEKQLQILKNTNFQLNKDNLNLKRKFKAELTTVNNATTELRRCKYEQMMLRQEIMRFNRKL